MRSRRHHPTPPSHTHDLTGETLGPCPPLTPENIHQGSDGRWYHDNTDVTDHPFAWQCAQGHSWHASLAIRTGDDDPGCPTCNPTPLDPAHATPEPVDLEAFTNALATAYDLVPVNIDNIDNEARQNTAQAAYQALLAFLNRNRTLIGIYDDEGGMTTLHHGYAVGVHGD